jgi:hypothetical protein
MLKLSVHQFVSHLPAEQQGYVLYSKEAFLDFLRSEFRNNERTRRALGEAAVACARRERVLVDALPDEREAARAVVYAYVRLADELRRRGKVKPPRKTQYTYWVEPTARKPKTRFVVVETTVNGRRERIEQYPPDVTWEEARAFQRNPDYELPDVGLEPEIAEVGETAHFGASQHPTGWGWCLFDGEPVGRVRCWDDSDQSPYVKLPPVKQDLTT